MNRRIDISKRDDKTIFHLYEDKYVGKFIVTITEIAYIDSISIVREYRGRDLSTIFWKDVKEYLKKHNIKTVKLIAKEDSERPGKLVKLYKKWKFRKDGKVQYKSVDYHTFIYQPMRANL